VSVSSLKPAEKKLLPCGPEEDYTGRKVLFPLDALIWPGYARLLELIKNNKQLQVSNGVPPSDSLVDGKIETIVGKRGTQAHKNKYDMCFEYSSFKPMFMKRDVIERFLVQVVFDPRQIILPPPEVSIEAHGGTTYSQAAARAAAAKRARSAVPGVSAMPELPPVICATAALNDNAALTPIRRGGTDNCYLTNTNTNNNAIDLHGRFRTKNLTFFYQGRRKRVGGLSW
jgi:hypothetical protein